LTRQLLHLIVGTTLLVACSGDNSSPTAPSSSSVSVTTTITDITLSVSTIDLNVGSTVTVTATATYSDGTSAQLSSSDWSSTNATVASVDNQGTVTAHAVGTATITASSSGHHDSASVNVTPTVALDRLVVTAQKKTLRVGETTTVTLTAYYSDGSQQQVTPAWSSRNTALATVTAAGTVTAVAKGTAVIWGTYEGKNPSVPITVIPATSLESLVVSAGNITLTVGQTTTLTAQANYSDGSQDQVAATYISRNRAVATVTSEGTVTAVKAGTATMTGTFSGISDSVGISVSDDDDVTLSNLSVSASSTTLEVGTTTTVTATATYSDGTTRTVTPAWSSSNTGVATVSPSGTVTAVAVGSTTISGTADGQSGSIVITVTAPTSTWRGIIVAEENRCSSYDSGDYSYPQSVEDAIIARLGGIYSPYTGECFASKTETDIEHMVARSEAHDSGLCAADGGTRRSFSQDLDNLTLASPAVNRNQKGGKDAATWLPDRNRCWFAATIIEVRRRYGLTIDQREASALDQVLVNCSSTELEPSDCDGGTESGIGVVINEFRTRGPMGANDEFIEILNNSSANVNIGGWQVVGSNNSGTTSVRRNIPSGIVLGVGCHYLLGNSNTNGYNGSTDTTYGVGITDTGGIALRKSDGTVVDQVGLSSGSAFKEGSPLPSFPGDNTNHSYSRPDVDTNNNLADFLMISPSTPKTSASSCVQ